MHPITYLELSWGVSRGRDTYGYNIARLRDTETGKRFRCMGGGYDMTGTVFADWLQDTYQDRLREIADRAYYVWDVAKQLTVCNEAGLYGMRQCRSSLAVSLDGGCGLSSIERIAREIGLSVRHVVSKRGSTTGFIVTDTRGVEL